MLMFTEILTLLFVNQPTVAMDLVFKHIAHVNISIVEQDNAVWALLPSSEQTLIASSVG